MIDFHNHVVPGVDDGAVDVEQSRAALRAMSEQGVSGLVATPHLTGSLTLQPARLEARLAELDAGWRRLREMASAEFPSLRLERGAEVMLDTTRLDLSDDRVRLAGTRFVLVEFPYMSVPPNSESVVFALQGQGWRPVIAHPERYSGVDDALEVVEDWKRAGGLLQVNSASLLGRYGTGAKTTAWRLLRRGWVDYLSSDYHARGRLSTAAVRAVLSEHGAAAQAHLLLEANGELLLSDRDPEPVPPIPAERTSLWQRIRSFGRG